MAKRAVPTKAQGRRARVAEAAKPLAPPVTPSKYDAMTVYDPTTKTVTGVDGVAVAVGKVTLAQLSLMPGPLAVLDRLYICETADEATIAMLANVAGCSIAALETKRHDWKAPPETCPATTPPNRRRCWKCPRWRETNETPF